MRQLIPHCLMQNKNGLILDQKTFLVCGESVNDQKYSLQVVALIDTSETHAPENADTVRIGIGVSVGIPVCIRTAVRCDG